jgi:S1-C subfamily serine protease
MKLYVYLLAALSLSADAAAQTKSNTAKNESVVMDRAASGNTTIEIKSDGVFVNGERVATREDLSSTNLHKKITIRDNIPASGSIRTSRNSSGAVLGVVTDVQDDRSGAHIAEVNKGSAADIAGLKRGDLIIRIDSVYVSDASDLVNTIRKYNAGDKVTVRYRRAEKEYTTTATLNAAPAVGMNRMFEFDYDDRPVFGPGFRRLLQDLDPFDDRPKLGMSVERNIAGLKAGNKVGLEVLRNGSRLTRTLSIPKPRNVKNF